ncbi:Hypothetical predicted protein [Podarcis lilfordi]|uniref:Uncharacterized protein n=1 Tax=Podarcis lilfordi TaxID=74358 RepID=A0AA35LH73_9SAUR|nr:Hypothetical predicted protein [Podarcis lilfordi]
MFKKVLFGLSVGRASNIYLLLWWNAPFNTSERFRVSFLARNLQMMASYLLGGYSIMYVGRPLKMAELWIDFSASDVFLGESCCFLLTQKMLMECRMEKLVGKCQLAY